MSQHCGNLQRNRKWSFVNLLDQQIPPVHEKTGISGKYIKSERHDVTLGCIRRGMQDTCFHCFGAWEPEVERMTFRTFCKTQLLTQLFYAGVRKGLKIYCTCFAEVVGFFFLLCTAHPHDEIGLSKVKVHCCCQTISSALSFRAIWFCKEWWCKSEAHLMGFKVLFQISFVSCTFVPIS